MLTNCFGFRPRVIRYSKTLDTSRPTLTLTTCSIHSGRYRASAKASKAICLRVSGKKDLSTNSKLISSSFIICFPLLNWLTTSVFGIRWKYFGNKHDPMLSIGVFVYSLSLREIIFSKERTFSLFHHTHSLSTCSNRNLRLYYVNSM